MTSEPDFMIQREKGHPDGLWVYTRKGRQWLCENILTRSFEDGNSFSFESEQMQSIVHQVKVAGMTVEVYEDFYVNWTGPVDLIENLHWHREDCPTYADWLEHKWEHASIDVANGVIQTGKLYRVTYECSDLHEDGEFVGYWTGYMDGWGKLTIYDKNGTDPYYLFSKEIVGLEEIAVTPEEALKDTTLYVIIRVKVKHPSNVDPEDVLNNCDYNFTSQNIGSTIIDTEMQEVNVNVPIGDDDDEKDED